MIRFQPTLPRSVFPCLAGVVALVLCCPWANAAPSAPLAANFQDWWLNANYAEHGRPTDQIFYFVFWLTSIITVAVEVLLVWFAIKYRHRPGGKKAIFSHGNTRVEMVWTLIPAVILIVLALWTKRVWDDYRYAPAGIDQFARILVIGEQFKWNVIYGGPKNKIGRYLLYPKPTDLTWPVVPEGRQFNFPDVPGPAYLPEDRAREILNDYILAANPLGCDFSDADNNPDPSGENPDLAKLNDRNRAMGRILVLPKGRAVEIQLSSRDVIHDFFLPNFRTKLDSVPGMRGKVYVTASNDCPGPRLYTLDQLQKLVDEKHEVVAIVNEHTPGAELHGTGRRKPKFWRIAANGETLLTNESFITADTIKIMRASGIPRVTATIAYDIVCEELCGIGHNTMAGKVIVLDAATLKQPPYNNYFPPVRGAENIVASPQVVGVAR